MIKLRKAHYLGVVLVVGSLMSWFAWQAYARSQVIGAMNPLLKNSSIRTDEAILIQVEPGNITFGEAIGKFTEHISEIDKNIIAVQSLDAGRTAEIQEAVVKYQKAGREVLRSLLSETRAAMATSSSVATEKSAFDDAMSETGYAYELASKRYKRSVEERKEAFDKWHASSREACSTAKTLSKVKASIAGTIDSRYLIGDLPLKKMLGECDEKAKKKS